MKIDRPMKIFIAAVCFQLVILAIVPASKVKALVFGTTVHLRTEPVDPYDIMSGYHVILGYEIARTRMPRGTRNGDTVYVLLRKGQDKVWNAVSAYASWPTNVAEDEVVIVGHKDYGRIRFGIESYFIPEDMRDEIEDSLRQVRRRAVMEVRVSSSGTPAIVRLQVGERIFDY